MGLGPSKWEAALVLTCRGVGVPISKAGSSLYLCWVVLSEEMWASHLLAVQSETDTGKYSLHHLHIFLLTEKQANK